MKSEIVLFLLGIGFAIILIDILLYIRKDKKQSHDNSEPPKEMKSIRRGHVKQPWNEISKQFAEHSAQFNKDSLSEHFEDVIDNEYSHDSVMPYSYFYIIGGVATVWFWLGTSENCKATTKNYKLIVSPRKSSNRNTL